jgi:predicted ATPase
LGLREEERTALEEAARRMGRVGVPRGEQTGAAGTPPAEASRPAPVPGSGATDGASEAAAPAVPHNLPVQLTRFIGRAPLVALVRGLLSGAPEGPHLVTLTGVGGGGKTRVALEAAAGVCEPSSFPDGVFFVGLAPLDDPGMVAPTIARTLGLPEGPGRSSLAHLQEALRGRRLLLLLDNMEHLLAAGPALTALLAACPALRVLVTSRAPLRLYGEREVGVPPLALPAPEAGLSVEHLAEYEAVCLFVARAQDVAPGFALTEENASAVGALCRRLDGLPLALELAATRSKVLAPAAILSRLERRLPLLTGGARDLPARHQTLRGALAWSYELLTPDEQALFRRLGVFSGGCTLEAAGVVGLGLAAEEGAAGPLDALEGIAGLVGQSLLQRVGPAVPAGADDEPRFLMLETMREYALEHLAAHGEEEGVRQRHAAYFAALAGAAYERLGGADAAPWLPGINTDATAYVRLIDNDYGNLLAALRWTIAQDDAAGSTRLVSALASYWAVQGQAGEGRPWVASVLPLVRTPEQTEARIGLLRWAAELATRHGDLEEARVFQDEALALSRQAGDARSEAIVLRYLAYNEWYRSDAAAARRHATASLALWRELGDRGGIADALCLLGDIANIDGNHAVAAPLLEESLRLARDIGDQATVAGTLDSLGQMALHDGDFGRAHALLEECLAIVAELGDDWFLTIMLHSRAWLALAEADYTAARDYLGRVITFFRERGMPEETGPALILVACLAVADDQLERALRLAATGIMLMGTHVPLGFRPAWEAAERQLERARQIVGEAACAAATAEGQAMSQAQAIAYALETLAPS